MVSSMAIGPEVMLGGNQVQAMANGKVRVTNPKGKVVVLSKAQFKKQTVKNMDKLQNDEFVEFKKDNKATVLGATVGLVAVTTALVFHKEVAKFMKNLFKSKNNKELTPNVFDGCHTTPRNSEESRVASETLDMKRKAIAEWTNERVKAFDSMVARTKGAVHASKQKMYERLFAKTEA